MLSELVVTAQKKEEALQDVPIAVSAFSGDALQARAMTGGQDLLLATPNVNFANGNFGSFNLQIRGIGRKSISTSGDPGVSIHENYSPVPGGALNSAKFFDVERVEVLRGPQGTLYGRNATGGVVNVITEKPDLGSFSGRLSAEYGNLSQAQVDGYINAPLGDRFAVRASAIYLRRDGFGSNLFPGDAFTPPPKKDIDGRDLYSARLSFRFEPTEDLRLDLMWEHFQEADDRARIGKVYCTPDHGPTAVGGVQILNTGIVGSQGYIAQGFLTQGCQNASIYSPAALGVVDRRASIANTLLQVAAAGGFGPLPPGVGQLLGGLLPGLDNQLQNSNVYDKISAISPIYKERNDFVQFAATWDPTPELRVSSLSSYSKTDLFTRGDYNGVIPTLQFGPLVPGTPGVVGNFPSNVFRDPQVGTTNVSRSFDLSIFDASEFNTELRLQSDYTTPLNFSVGYIYTDAHSNGDYYVMGNTLTYVNALVSGANAVLDPNPIPNRSGNNYSDGHSVYDLKSHAVFGEIYYRLSNQLKLTAGVRYNKDSKTVETYASPLLGVPIPRQQPQGLLGQPGPITRKFEAVSGRFGLDYKVDENHLLYAFASRGFKPGGINPGVTAGLAAPPTYDSEYVHAIELGSKNSFPEQRAFLNATAFYYDYNGYQVAALINRTAVNSNLDARIYGVELEGAWEPIEALRVDGTLGYLHTKALGGANQIDQADLTQGDPAFTAVKSATASLCIAPTSAVAALLTAINAGAAPGAALASLCPQGGNPALPNGGAGVTANVKGNRLPNSPEFTLNVGVQYTFQVAEDWTLVPRVDFYHQTSSFARIFNDPVDRLRAYSITNLTVRLQNEEAGWLIEGYVKNAADSHAIQDMFLKDVAAGRNSNALPVDPRLYGMRVTKQF